MVERPDGTVSGVMLQVPKRCLSFRAGKEADRSLSEDQKTELRERLAAARNKK